MGEKRKKVLFIGVSFVLQMIFLQIPTGKSIDFFLFSDNKCTLQEFIYYCFGHIQLIYLFYFMYNEIASIKKELKIFYWLVWIDFIDFLLTYNSVWINSISFNLIQLFIIGYIIITVEDD